MMATTHGFVALAAATLSLPVLSEYASAPLVLTAAFLGGVAPDLDLVAIHRRTLHFPVLSPLTAVLAAGLAAAVPSPWTVAAAVFLGAAALHAASDVLGGSAEHEPWNPTTERGVYNHLLGRWHRPRRVVAYSGAPADLLFAAPFAAVAVAAPATGGFADTVTLALFAGSAGYVLVRKRLGAVAVALERALSTPMTAGAGAPATDAGDGATGGGDEQAEITDG